MKKCPFCAEKIRDEAIICRYCGKDLPHPLETESKNNKTSPERKYSQKPKRGIWAWLLAIFFFVTSLILLFALVDIQYRADYATGRYDRALEEIRSLRKQVVSLNNSEIATKVNFVNNFCKDVYVFADGRPVAFANATSSTLFYIPRGPHDIQYCTSTDKSNCGIEFTETIDTEVFTLQTKECD